VVAVPTFTFPNVRLVALIPSFGTDEPNCRANVGAAPPAFAVSVTVVAVLTEDTVAVKLALVAPAGTVTEAGTLTAELLLASATANPPLAAAPFSVTVQLSVPAAENDPVAQLSPPSTGTPVPLKFTTIEVPVEELLARISCPVAVPEVNGSNCKLRVAVWPGFSVIGNPPPEVEKPVPDSAAPVTVTAEFPVDVNVTDCVVAVFTATFPNARLPVLKVSAGACAPSCKAKLAGGPNALAVNITVCEVLTGETVALKLALVAPAATVTVPGTATAELLLARPTVIPPLAGEALSATAQLSVAAPATEPFEQFRPVKTGTPAPFNFTIDDDPPEESLVIVIRPVAGPATVGLNPTLSVAVCPGLRVNGKLAPDAVKPEPANVSALIVTGSVPVDDSVTA
jgi:hypothetical protein